MKNIEIDDELYLHIVSNTQSIGESASSILRRLLKLDVLIHQDVIVSHVAGSEAKSETLLKEQAVDDSESTNDSENNNAIEKHDVVKDIEISSESLFNFINKEELAMQRGAVGRFLLILAALYRAHPRQFNVVTDICGRDRLYFAHSEAELAASGSSTKPKQIPDSPFWVMTNSNTTRKKMMLTKAATSLGYNQLDVEKIRELL